MALQEKPKSFWVNVKIDLPRGIFRYETIDLMEMAGYSRKVAREFIRNHWVWQPFDGYWTLTGKYSWINFLTKDRDVTLAIQKEPYYDGSRVPENKEMPWLTRAWGNHCIIVFRR